MPDRRRQFRFPLRSPVEFTGADPKNVTFGFATDLSSAGAFVQTAFPAALGSPVVLRLWRPGWSDELHLCGVVRWSRRHGMGVGMGVEFESMGLREARLIDDLLGESLPVARAM
jgi:uncharacterized protein (TIGR02266 family)